MRLERKKLYFASPLFCEAERGFNERLVEHLERWCDVFLPQRDGGLISDFVSAGMTSEDAYQRVFDRDIAAIRACDGVVINLDGRVVDEGAAFELGFAHALGKVCVGFSTDVRVLLTWGLNPMITAPLSVILRSEAELEGWAMSYARSMYGPCLAAE